MLSHTLSPSCSGAAGVYTIIPSLPNFTNSVNYTITYINSQLYINPKGSGADDVDTYLECVEDRGVSYVPANRRYVARFYAKNTNSTPVYVPIGANNKLSSTGSFDSSLQPVVFLPGNGTTRFNVPFDGVQLKWELRTYEGNTLVLEYVTAKSTSVRCSVNTSSPITAPLAAIIMSPEESKTVEEPIAKPEEPAKAEVKPKKIAVEPKPIVVEKNTTKDPKLEVAGKAAENKAMAYPNPANNRISITIQSGFLNEKGIWLYDANGRSCTVKITKRISQNSLELDVSLLRNGFYLIRIKLAEGYRILRFVKG